MKTTTKKVSQLINDGIICPPIDGNHGEKHPKTTDYVDDGVPFILVPDLKDGVVDLDNCNHISYDQAKTLNKGFSRSGDVLFTHKATIGKVAIVDTKGYEYIILTPQVTYYRVNKLDVLSNVYLYYYFCSKTFQNTFRLYASSGGTRDYLGIVAQQKLPIIFPDIDYQLRIVAILEKYDNLIRNNNKRIKLLENIVDNLYKEWFVRFRFPGYETAEFENGIPKGWKYIRADKVIDFNPTIKCNNQSDFTIIPMEALSTTSMVLDSSCFVKQETLTGKRSQNGDVLFAKITPCLENGKTGFVMGLAEGEVAGGSTEFIVLRSKALTPHYVYCIARSYYFRQTAILSMNGADGRQRVDESKLKSTKVFQPTELVLNSFERVVSPIFDLVYKLTQKNKVLIKQRDLLLPRLMSGKLEV